MEPLFVVVKTWRDRTYGNPYVSARVYQGERLLGVVPFQYGSDRLALQEARELPEVLAILPVVDGRSWCYLDRAAHEAGIACHVNVVPSTKRQAEAHGRAA